METEATNVYLDGQLCTRLNTGIYMAGGGGGLLPHKIAF